MAAPKTLRTPIAKKPSSESPLAVVMERWILPVLLLAGLAVSFRPQALFFAKDRAWPLVIAIALGLVGLFVLKKRELPGLKTPLGIGLITGGLALLSTVLWAANRGEAIGGILIFAAGGALLLLGRQIGRQSWVPEGLAVFLAALASGLTLQGLGVAAGLFFYPDAVYAGRLSSFFQYPNTLAGFAFAAFLPLALAGKQRRWWHHPLLFTSALGFMLADSRGAWVVGAPLLLLVAIANWRRIADWLVVVMVHLGTAFIVSQPLLKLIEPAGFGRITDTHALQPMARWLLVGLGAAWILCLVWDLVVARFSLRVRLGVTLGTVVAGAAAAWALVGRLAGNALVARLLSLGQGNNDPSLLGRSASMKDGLHVFTHAPLGLGWGGWFARYKEFQAFGYTINFPHSAIEQALVDYGILGIVAFLLIWGWFAFQSVRKRAAQNSDTDQQSVLRETLGWAALALIGHACLDVDFAFGAIVFTIFLVMGVALSNDAGWQPISGIGLFAGGAVGLVLLGVGMVDAVGYGYDRAGQKAVAASNFDAAVVDYQAATRYHAWNGNSWRDLVNAVARRANRKPLSATDTQLVVQDMIQWAEVNPTSAEAHLNLANYYRQTLQWGQAIAESSAAVQYAPWDVKGYESLLLSQVGAYNAAMTAKPVDQQKASQYLQGARDTLKALDERYRSEPKNIGPYAMQHDTPVVADLRKQLQAHP